MNRRRFHLAWMLLSFLALSCGAGMDPADGGSTKPDENDLADGKSDSAFCERVPIPPLAPPDLSQSPSVVTLDENGSFVVNGEPFWPFGFYHIPDEDGIDEVAEAGFNTIVFGGGCCQGDSLENQIADLTYLRDHGLLGAPHALSPVSQIYSVDPETIRGWLAARGDTGGLLFWYTYDEPALHEVPLAEAADYHALLGELDPNHPDALVEAALENYDQYMPFTDFMMIDPYPAPAYPLSYLRECYREADAATGGQKRVMGVGQSFDWYVMYGQAPEGHEWRPTVHEMRNMTYQYMVLGANGLVYFAYDYVYSQPDRWAGLLAVAREVKELMPLLVRPPADVTVPEIPDTLYLDHAVKELNGIYYLLVVSTWYDDVTIDYDLSAIGADVCVVDYFRGTQVPVRDGRITLTLPKEGDRVLQIIPTGAR